MHLTAYMALLLALVGSILAGFSALIGAWREDALQGEKRLFWAETGQTAAAALMTVSSLFLFTALAGRDYSLYYVYQHVDNVLPLLYALTAFWGGQEGSLLFWAWMVGLCGAVYVYTPGYKSLALKTKLVFWVFFMAVQAFFLLLLTCWSNPFVELRPLQINGTGLNPLLRNPGMIFHPPLLFLGYGGFTIPACLALASSISGEPRPWVSVSRNWIVTAWIFLTAGIALGGWWSYMELGWGGYWAWDPVENASLIPWLSATAFLHTALIESSRGALRRTNIFLISLTFLLCIFATYLVRSNVVQSLHAFGAGGVALPLLFSLIVGLGLTFAVLLYGEQPVYRSLSSPMSRQGFLVMAAWLLLGLGLVVTLGTMWPVLSKPFTANPVGLDADFYNRVCLPLFTLIILLLCACPWIGWKEGIRNRSGLFAVLGVFVGAAVVLFAIGIRNPTALIAAAGGVAVLAGMILQPILLPGVRRVRKSLGAAGVHAGLALVFVGIAFSGPYQVVREQVVEPGGSLQVEDYTLTYKDLTQQSSLEMAVARARIEVSRDGKVLGELLPERRVYRGFESPFAEVSVMPGLGDELYAVLLGFDQSDRISLKISVNPLVNWVWIGCTVMCLMGILLFRGKSPMER